MSGPILPVSGVITMDEILDAYGAPLRTPLSAMVQGGDYVPSYPVGFPGSGVPTAPPIALTDFYNAGWSGLYEDANFTLKASRAGYDTAENIKVLGLSNGVPVAYNYGFSSVDTDAKFTIDVKFRMNAASNPQPDVFGEGTNVYYVAFLGLGLARVNPAVSTPLQIVNSMLGWQLQYKVADEPNNEMRTWFGGPISANSSTSNYGAQIFAGYQANVLPSKTDYTAVRLSRSTISNGYAEWKLELFGDRGSFITVARTLTHDNNPPPQDSNTGGYPVLVCQSSQVTPGDNFNIDIVSARLNVANDTVAPWTW